MSTTPRTDKEWAYYVEKNMTDAGQAFARGLEIELQQSTAYVRELLDANDRLLQRAEKAEAERDALKAKLYEPNKLSKNLLPLALFRAAMRTAVLNLFKTRNRLLAERDQLKAQLAVAKNNRANWELTARNWQDTANALQKQLDEARKDTERWKFAAESLRNAYAPDGHIAPHDCFATGPRTCDPIQDYVCCPGCAAERAFQAAIDAAKGGGK